MMKLDLDVAGFKNQIELTEDQLDRIYRPSLDLFLRPNTRKGPAIFFVAGPPGSGKSTFAAIIASLARSGANREITVLPMDGFHFPNAYLKSHCVVSQDRSISLIEVKGSPESFDRASLKNSLTHLSRGKPICWPIYDRRLHDVVPDALRLAGTGKNIFYLVEGNYLLLDEPGWRDLHLLATKTLFLTADEDLLIARLIARHIRGGKSPEVAQSWVMEKDLLNIHRVLSHRLPSDLTLSASPQKPCG